MEISNLWVQVFFCAATKKDINNTKKMEPRTWLHIFLLLSSLVGFCIVSWHFNSQKVAEHNNRTSPTASDQAVAFALGLGWWGAFGFVYLLTWHALSSSGVKRAFGAIVFVMVVFFVSAIAFSVKPVSPSVYRNYGFSLLPPLAIAMVVDVVMLVKMR